MRKCRLAFLYVAALVTYDERDAAPGDAILFAREDYVEDAWGIVDPVLQAATPVYAYEAHTWGPSEVEHKVVPSGGWDNPIVTG